MVETVWNEQYKKQEFLHKDFIQMKLYCVF